MLDSSKSNSCSFKPFEQFDTHGFPVVNNPEQARKAAMKNLEKQVACFV
jgi:hypothetical protein